MFLMGCERESIAVKLNAAECSSEFTYADRPLSLLPRSPRVGASDPIAWAARALLTAAPLGEAGV